MQVRIQYPQLTHGSHPAGLQHLRSGVCVFLSALLQVVGTGCLLAGWLSEVATVSRLHSHVGSSAFGCLHRGVVERPSERVCAQHKGARATSRHGFLHSPATFSPSQMPVRSLLKSTQAPPSKLGSKKKSQETIFIPHLCC